MHVHNDLDILKQADEVALRELADNALASYNVVFENLNDQLVAQSDEDSSDVSSTRSYDMMTGGEKLTPPSSPSAKPAAATPVSSPKLKPRARKTKLRPDTPPPISPPTPEEYQEARRTVFSHCLYKTSECTAWTPQFGCPCGINCRFLHPGEIRRPRPSQRVLEESISHEAWRLSEIRQLPRALPARQYVQSRRH